MNQKLNITFKDFEFVVYIPTSDVLYTQNGFLHIKPKRLENEYGENTHLGSLDLGNELVDVLDLNRILLH